MRYQNLQYVFCFGPLKNKVALDEDGGDDGKGGERGAGVAYETLADHGDGGAEHGDEEQGEVMGMENMSTNRRRMRHSRRCPARGESSLPFDHTKSHSTCSALKLVKMCEDVIPSLPTLTTYAHTVAPRAGGRGRLLDTSTTGSSGHPPFPTSVP